MTYVIPIDASKSEMVNVARADESAVTVTKNVIQDATPIKTRGRIYYKIRLDCAYLCNVWTWLPLYVHTVGEPGRVLRACYPKASADSPLPSQFSLASTTPNQR